MVLCVNNFMAGLFATQSPQNIDCPLIYDSSKRYYRPLIDTDFVGGAAGVDAFGRQRVSNPETIFSSKQIFDNQPLYWDDVEESGSGTSSTYSAYTASSVLSVSANTAGKRTRQTKMYFNYQSSKSQLVLITGVIKKSGGGSGITSRIGYFDDDNGLFFENVANTIKVVRRTSVTGSPVDNAITQSNWNLDKMDGSGQSQKNLDFTKTQIFIIDFEWLGVGRVRFGFNVDGVTYYCHEILNANNLSTVYMSTPNLPLRYQIINNGSGPASSLECICSSVTSEGGTNDIATNLSIDTGTTAITLTKNQENAVIGIKLNDGYRAASLALISLNILLDSAANYRWTLRLNPTVAGTFTYSASDTYIKRAIGDGLTNTVSGGTKLVSNYSSNISETTRDELRNLLKLGSKIDGTMDTLVLSVYPIGANNINAFAAINYYLFG